MTKVVRNQDPNLQRMYDELIDKRDRLREEASELSAQQSELYRREQALLEEANNLNRAANALETAMKGKERTKKVSKIAEMSPDELRVVLTHIQFTALVGLYQCEGEWVAPPAVARLIGSTSTKISGHLAKLVLCGVAQRRQRTARRSEYKCLVDLAGVPLSMLKKKTPEPKAPEPKPAPAAPESRRPHVPKPKGTPAKQPATGLTKITEMSAGRRKQLIVVAEKSMEQGRWYTAPGVVEAAIAVGLVPETADRTKTAGQFDVALKQSNLIQRQDESGRLEFKLHGRVG